MHERRILRLCLAARFSMRELDWGLCDYEQLKKGVQHSRGIGRPLYMRKARVLFFIWAVLDYPHRAARSFHGGNTGHLFWNLPVCLGPDSLEKNTPSLAKKKLNIFLTLNP